MIFSSATKGYFLEMSEHAVLMARTSSPTLPFTIEELQECAPGDPAALAECIQKLQPKRSSSGYFQANIGIYPDRRLIRRHTLDPKKVKEKGYLEEVCAEQLQIELDKYTVAVLNAEGGTNFDAAAGLQKEVLFCGLPLEDIRSIQAALIEQKIYPLRLELGTVAMLGALVDYLGVTKTKVPALLLEISSDATHAFIVSANGVEASRPIAQGLDSMIPVVQKELGLKDEESARKLFYSNTFDFTGMGPLLAKRLLKELQSSIGFYEVQTGQSVGQVITTQLSPKLAWIETVMASVLGIPTLKIDARDWLKARDVTLPEKYAQEAQEVRWLGIFSLLSRFDKSTAAPVEDKK